MKEELFQSSHIPVLQKETIKYLDPKPNENFIDCTIGEAGHTAAILERNQPNGKVIGIDWSPEAIKNCGLKLKNFKERIILVCDSFVNLEEIIKKQGSLTISGILLDLGFSSWHLEKSEKGFSFQKREPMDMRYNPQNQLTAEKILNYWSKPEIEKILREYGQEQFSEKISKEICESRILKTIKTTFQLIEIIQKATPFWYQRKKIHPATRTFQALRIAVNDELNNLEKVLPQILKILKPGGKLAVISFHSLEDKIVKNFLKKSAYDIKILTKKPITPTEEEIKINPRSRSAKLRTARR